MAFRLVLDCVQQQVSRRICSTVIRRTYCNEKVFKSLLADTRVASPFADPSKTIASPVVVDTVKHFSVAREAPTDDCDIKSSKAKTERPPDPKPSETTKEVPKEPKKPVVKEEPERLSAIEELNLLKETLSKGDDQSDSGGSKGSGDEHTFDEEAEKEKRRKRLERNTRIGGFVLFGSTVAGLVSFCLYYVYDDGFRSKQAG
ncbi:hypothetical protein ANCCAN_13695 [Ancylostoma caninum]|uniref:Uncharacterized protein n=1 Tax=Ancylostoma caninum TaxID=29170 RepID=A0A368G7H5_ANCCA|nr:hypothetical protein ANCCAN_13695 [Ancylostoma caninum]